MPDKADYSEKAKDRQDFVDGTHIYISSPDLRSLYYDRGYEDGIDNWGDRLDRGIHPDNFDAYQLGFVDGKGDRENLHSEQLN